MKKIFLYLVFPIIFFSCSTSKQIHQEKTLTHSEISSKENTVSESQIFSVTKIIESKDTILLLPASQLTMSAKFQSLLEGDTIYATGEDLSLKTFYDSLTRTIKTQATGNPKSVPILFQKITETRQLATGTVITNKHEQQKQTIRTENKDKQIQRNSLPWWLIIFFIILIIGLVGFLVMKFRK